MTTIPKTFATALLLSSVLGACSTASVAQSSASAGPASAPVAASPTREAPLLDSVLNGLKTADGKSVDAVMYIANFPPGSVSGRHSHPGWEFNYILKGAVTFEVVGQAPYTLKAGQGMYNQRGNIHTVRNASQTEPAQLVSVLVKDQGAPVAVSVP